MSSAAGRPHITSHHFSYPGRTRPPTGDRSLPMPPSSIPLSEVFRSPYPRPSRPSSIFRRFHTIPCSIPGGRHYALWFWLWIKACVQCNSQRSSSTYTNSEFVKQLTLPTTIPYRSFHVLSLDVL